MLCAAYRPPNNNEFWESFERNIEHVKSTEKCKYMLILGDFNADFNDVNGHKLLQLCVVQNLNCHITEATRITATTKTCLDQIISNMPNFISKTTVMPPVSTNDHCTVSVNLNFKIVKEQPYNRIIWLYNEGDFEGFRDALEHVNWNDCFESGCVNNACMKWNETFLNIARAFIPNKVVLVRPNDSPWFTNELRNLKRKVNRLYQKAKVKPNPTHWENYRKANLDYKNQLDNAERVYNESLYDSLST